MIPRRFIQEWKEHAVWFEDFQVEQDLVIERVLVELFSEQQIREKLAFRGGTALHKIYLKPQSRYSEDIDLVQINSEPIKETIKCVQSSLNFLGKSSVRQSESKNTITFRFESEIPPVIKLRIKLEINCREHFSVLGHKEVDHRVENSWFRGFCKMKTFEVEEMLGSKIRALYQRKKGRDLFDLFWAVKNIKLDICKIIYCYNEYISNSVDNPPSKSEIIRNVEKKLTDPDFTGDVYGILRPDITYDHEKAFNVVKKEILEKI